MNHIHMIEHTLTMTLTSAIASPGSPAMQNIRALLMRVKAVLEVQRAAVAETSAHFVSFHKVSRRPTCLQRHLSVP